MGVGVRRLRSLSLPLIRCSVSSERDEGVEIWKLIEHYQKVLDSIGETMMKSVLKRGVVPPTIGSQHSELSGVVTYRAGSLLEPHESSKILENITMNNVKEEQTGGLCDYCAIAQASSPPVRWEII